ELGPGDGELGGLGQRVARAVELGVELGGAARAGLGADEIALGELGVGEIERGLGAGAALLVCEGLLDLALLGDGLGDLACAQQALGERAALLGLRRGPRADLDLWGEVAGP